MIMTVIMTKDLIMFIVIIVVLASMIIDVMLYVWLVTSFQKSYVITTDTFHDHSVSQLILFTSKFLESYDLGASFFSGILRKKSPLLPQFQTTNSNYQTTSLVNLLTI